MNNSNGWTDKKENLIREFRDEANANSWKHDREAKKNRKWDKLIGVPGFVLAFIAGNVAFITAQSTYQFIGYLIGAITMLGGLLSALQNMLGLADKKQKHKTFSSKWLEFYHFTRLILSETRNERPNSKTCTKELQQLYQELAIKSPGISEKTSNEYDNKLKSGYFDRKYHMTTESMDPEVPVAVFRAMGHIPNTDPNEKIDLGSSSKSMPLPQESPSNPDEVVVFEMGDIETGSDA